MRGAVESEGVSARRGIGRRQLLAAGAGLVGAALAPLRAFAQGEFPAGQTIELLNNASEGSSVTLILQELAGVIERRRPGTRIVTRSNPGGTAALTSAMLAAAEPDGLTIGTMDVDSLISKTLGTELFDISEFTLIGSLARRTGVLFATRQSGITSMEDLQARREPANLPSRSTSSGSYFQALLVNALLGTRIRPVTGYSSGERELAFRNGEVQLEFPGVSTSQRYLDEGIGVPLTTLNSAPLPEVYGNPPSLNTFDPVPAFSWVLVYFDAVSYTHILGMPPNVPGAMVEAWRDLFMEASADAAFQSAVAELTILSPVRGDVVEAAIGGLLGQLGSFADSLAQALECGMQLAETGESCAA